MRKYLGLLLILAVVLAACVPVPVAPTLPESRGLQPTEVNSLRVRQTLDVAGATALDGGITVGDALTLGTTGQVIIAATADADTANYDNLLLIEHNLVGLGTKDRVYGINIEMTRPAGYGTTNGDHDDAGLKIRMNNKAVDNTVGTVMRGVDVNVKNDNPSGAITTLSGATFTVQTDTGSPPAGNVSTAYAVQGQITANAPITDSLIVADFRNFRQTATEPTIEYGVQIRNGNTTGTGIDRGLSFASEAATVGNFGYIIDMNDAAATTADIRLSQGETIDNLTDGTVAVGGALLATGLLSANGGIAVDTNAFTVADVSGNTTIAGTLTVGGLRTVWGSDTITATAAVTHGLATPQYAFCTLGEDTSAAKAICTVLISGATVTVKVWKADGTTAGDAGTLVYWQVVGTP